MPFLLLKVCKMAIWGENIKVKTQVKSTERAGKNFSNPKGALYPYIV